MTENDFDPVASQGIIDMLTVANEFCLFTEKADQYQSDDIIRYYSKICPLLYLKGTMLPVLENEDDYFGERFVNEEQWEAVYNSLRSVLDTQDEFFTSVSDLSDDQLLTASIAEHLADIYQDLKDFVLLYTKNMAAAQRSAIIDCRSLFISHWGIRIAALLPALHKLAFKPADDTDLY